MILFDILNLFYSCL